MRNKERLRSLYQRKRNAIPLEARAACNRAIIANLMPICAQAGRIFAFHPARGEPDIHPLLGKLIREGRKVALPAIRGSKMIFHLVRDPELCFQESVFGIPQPGEEAPRIHSSDRTDIALTPGLAFTSQGTRLGYGGGFYDRFLKEFSGTSIAVAYTLQLAITLPASDHDRRVDYICTEEGVQRCSDL